MNILAKIKELHNILGDYTYEQTGFAGIRYPLEMDRVRTFIRKGKWAQLHFSAFHKTRGTRDVIVFPHLKSDLWPVGESSASRFETIFIYSNFKALLVEPEIWLGWERKKYFDHLKENSNKYYECKKPIADIFNAGAELDLFMEFATKSDLKLPLNKQAMSTARRELKLKLDPSNEMLNFYSFIDNCQRIRNNIEKVPMKKYGIYENLIYSWLSYNAALSSRPKDIVAEQILLGFKYPHGMNSATWPEPADDGHYSDTAKQVRGGVKRLFSHIFDYGEYHTKEVKNTPEFYIAAKMHEDQGGYKGIAHFEMAAVMEEQFNNPIQAWIFLVSAGFWMGRNMPDAQGTCIQAAIELCGRHDWVEAKEVLEYNLAILNEEI